MTADRSVVLGFDTSLTATGAVAMDYESGELVGACVFQTDPKTPLVTRLAGLNVVTAGWVQQVIAGYGSANIAIEDGISHRNGATTRKLAMAWTAVALAAFNTNGIPPMEVNVTEVKRMATGNARASKEDMIDAALAQWDNFASLAQPAAHTSDVADAAWVAEVARQWIRREMHRRNASAN